MPQLLKPMYLEPVLHNKRSHHNEKPAHRNKETYSSKRKPPHSNEDPVQPKRNKSLKKYIIYMDSVTNIATPTWILTIVPNLLKCSLSLVMLFNSWGIFLTSNLVFVYWFFLKNPGLLWLLFPCLKGILIDLNNLLHYALGKR